MKILTLVKITVPICKLFSPFTIETAGYRIKEDFMPKIAIMTDSNCGIMPDDAQNYHIHILPMPVLVGKRTFMKDALSHQKSFTETFFRRTCYNFPAIAWDVMKMWDQLLKEHDEVVHVPMSSGLAFLSDCPAALEE